MERIVYKEIAQCIGAIKDNSIKADIWAEYLDDIVKNYLPSGSGIDSGNSIDIDKSNSDKIVINSSFHCMDENGYYCGWNDYTIIITPSLQFDIDMKISFHGVKSKSYGLKDYLLESYNYWLTRTMKDSDNIGAYLC